MTRAISGAFSTLGVGVSCGVGAKRILCCGIWSAGKARVFGKARIA